MVLRRERWSDGAEEAVKRENWEDRRGQIVEGEKGEMVTETESVIWEKERTWSMYNISRNPNMKYVQSGKHNMGINRVKWFGQPVLGRSSNYSRSSCNGRSSSTSSSSSSSTNTISIFNFLLKFTCLSYAYIKANCIVFGQWRIIWTMLILHWEARLQHWRPSRCRYMN